MVNPEACWVSKDASHLKGTEEPADVFPARGLHDRFLVLVQDRADVLNLQPAARFGEHTTTWGMDGERFCTFE